MCAGGLKLQVFFISVACRMVEHLQKYRLGLAHNNTALSLSLEFLAPMKKCCLYLSSSMVHPCTMKASSHRPEDRKRSCEISRKPLSKTKTQLYSTLWKKNKQKQNHPECCSQPLTTYPALMTPTNLLGTLTIAPKFLDFFQAKVGTFHRHLLIPHCNNLHAQQWTDHLPTRSQFPLPHQWYTALTWHQTIHSAPPITWSTACMISKPGCQQTYLHLTAKKNGALIVATKVLL